MITSIVIFTNKRKKLIIIIQGIENRFGKNFFHKRYLTNSVGCSFNLLVAEVSTKEDISHEKFLSVYIKIEVFS